MATNTGTENTVVVCPDPDFSYNRNSIADRMKKVRLELLKMNKSSHNISGTYKEILRAFRNVLAGIVYIDAENNTIEVKNIHANPERAIAKIHQQDNTILPITSVAQAVTNNDDSRRRYDPMIVSEKYWDTSEQRAIRILSFPPRPVNIIYDVNIWSKYITDIDQISEQIRLYFNPSLQLSTPDNSIIKAFLEEESDEGNSAAGDGTDRLIRKTLTVSVEAYIPSPKYLYTSTGKIQQFKLDKEIHKICT